MLHYGTLIKVREFRAKREYSHALRLENASLRESLSDLRAGYANPATHAVGVRRRVRFLVWGSKKRTGALLCS